MTRITLAITAVLSLAITPLAAQDFQKGYDAYQAGDYATALQEWRPLVDQGDASSQLHLGFLYSDGNGVPQDYVMAVGLYRLAAEQGNHLAQGSLGNMYQSGEGVLQDYVLAHMWFNIAASNGWVIASHQRDAIAASRMTKIDISKAQAMAHKCMSSGYQDCGY